MGYIPFKCTNIHWISVPNPNCCVVVCDTDRPVIDAAVAPSVPSLAVQSLPELRIESYLVLSLHSLLISPKSTPYGRRR